MYTKELQNLVSPAFTDEFLYSVVRRKTGWKDISIRNIVLDGGEEKKGDSYISTVTRFKIEALGKSEGDTIEKPVVIAVITKTIPKNVARRKTFRSHDLFSNEINFYEIVWDTFVQFIKSKHLDEKLEDILPLYLGSISDGENTFIALEDASFHGYEGIDRSKGLDFDHTMSIIKCFAKFHAIAYAYKGQQPDNFNIITASLQETYIHEKWRSWYVPFQKNLIATVRDCVEKQLPGTYLDAYDTLTIKSDFYRTMSEICAKQTQFSVVTHGDAWLPNFLIKRNVGGPSQPLLIDFQLARCSSLGLDLGFFMYTCTDQKLREEYLEDFIRGYVETFRTIVKMLGSDASAVTYEQIMKEISDSGPFSVGMSMEGIVMSILDDDEVADIDGIQGIEAVPLEKVWILHPFKCEEKQKRIADMIKHAVDNKFI